MWIPPRKSKAKCGLLHDQINLFIGTGWVWKGSEFYLYLTVEACFS